MRLVPMRLSRWNGVEGTGVTRMGHLKLTNEPGRDAEREPRDVLRFPAQAVSRIGRYEPRGHDPVIAGVEHTLDHMGKKLQELRLLLDPGDPDRPRAA